MKRENKNLMSKYEEDLMWMAYRYAIGRHTISTYMMANDMANNGYDRLNPERRNFMAKDIREQIADVLRFNSFSFNIDYSVKNENFRPLELFIEFINKTDNDELDSIKSVKVYNNLATNEIIYSINHKDSRQDKFPQFFDQNVILDLIPWMNLANAFDTNSHKFINIDGEDIEYIESYTRLGDGTYKKYGIPLDNFVHGNGMECLMIDEK